MKTLLMIAALSIASPPLHAEKPAPESKQPTDMQGSLPVQDQGAVSHRLHWDSRRQQLGPMRISPAKERAGPEIR